MHVDQIRKDFLQYFEKKGHAIYPSSPVIPHEDPTLLFTNAGMNQFKDFFLGKRKASVSCIATSQKCIRAGGKHNDLENVGHTTRHLTFFEMLGNFSFGDYFKEKAIQYAFEVSLEVFGFDKNKIWATVFEEDEEALSIWTQYLPKNRIVKMGEKDNFWAMGPIGPCGPCSELYYDRGDFFSKAKSPLEDPTGERYLEFWNLVFMQYNRQEDGSFEELPRKGVDTGAGIERLVSLKMGVHSVFETDLFCALIQEIEKNFGLSYAKSDQKASFHVIADHLRSLSFAIADGAQPSNLDRGYVLRKILRRAVRYGRTLGAEKPFLSLLLPKLIELMGGVYPELIQAKGRIQDILSLEEENFLQTLKRGEGLLTRVMEEAHKRKEKIILGQEAFKLKDTYGLPFEEIALLAHDEGLFIEKDRFEALEKEAKERSRKAHVSGHERVSLENEPFFHKMGITPFHGYQTLEEEAHIKGILTSQGPQEGLKKGEKGIVFLSHTPFYASMGGQVGDTGLLKGASFEFHVTNTFYPYAAVVGHEGFVQEGALKIGDGLIASVDKKRREGIEHHHTATHLLHFALQEILGSHIRQAGSLVEEERLRFDFSHHKALSKEEIERIEDLINEKIRLNTSVRTYELSYKEVQNRKDIKQFFGDKYGEEVRVVDAEFSKELCGGTHVEALGSIGYFRIAKEASIASGVRRIEAVAGKGAEKWVQDREKLLDLISQKLKAPEPKLFEALENLLEEKESLQKQLNHFEREREDHLIEKLLHKKEALGSITFIGAQVSLPIKKLRELALRLEPTLQKGVIVLASQEEASAGIILKVTKDLSLKATDWIGLLATHLHAKGGGKPDFVQAGAPNLEQFQPFLEALKRHILTCV